MKQLIYIPLACSLLCGCHNSEKGATPAATVAAAPDTVAAFILHDTSVAKSIELPAELLPYEQAQLFSRVQGYVREIKVDIGDKVHRGQTLALIEAPELQTKYAEFQSSLQAAKARYMSSADLYQRLYRASQAKTPGIVAPVDLERSHNQLLADSASWESARKLAQSYREMADYLVIQAPFDGIVTARSVDRGALVGNNQVVLTVQDNRTMRLRIAVPELYVASGGSIKETAFRVDAWPEKLFSATLTRKSESIDPVTRTELWEFIYHNQNNELKAGTFAYVKLNLQRTGHSFVVPPSAIVTTQERKFILCVKNGKVAWVDVRQGLSTDKGIEIFGAIANGDTLVLRGSDERKPGSTAYWKLPAR